MRRRSAFASLVLLIAAPLFAQAGTPNPAQDTISQPAADSSKIHLDVVVTRKTGPPVSGLQQQDFTVLDNKGPTSVTSFRAVSGSEAPVEVVLVIDAVNTSYQNVGYERGEIAKYLTANGGHLSHPTTLAIVTDSGAQIQKDFSNDGNALNDALTTYTVGLRTIQRSAGFYGATERFDLSLKALHMLLDREAARPGRKLILWISPGWPILSGPHIDLDSKQQRQIFSSIVDISTEMRRGHITLYSVDSLGVSENVGRTLYYQQFTKGISKLSQTDLGDLSLQVLAVQSGGLALNSSDVSSLLQHCVADADNYYELVFDTASAEQPNEYHHLQVELKDPSLTARTRQGYYAQPAGKQ